MVKQHSLHNKNLLLSDRYKKLSSYSIMPSLQSFIESIDHSGVAKSKTPYEAILENIPGGIIILEFDDTLHITHCNSWASEVSGFSAEELGDIRNADPLSLIHPYDVPLLMMLLEDVQNGKDVININYRMICKDGSYLTVMLRASMTERTDKKIVFYGIQTDVTEHIRLKTELEDSKRQLGGLVEAITGGLAIIELGENFGIHHYGHWICDYTGFTLEELDRRSNNGSLETVWHEDIEAVIQDMRQVVDHKNTFDMDLRMNTSGGGYKWVHVTGAVIERNTNFVKMYVIFTALDKD